MVTKEQKKLVTDSWELVRQSGDLDEIGRTMFLRLFQENPELLPLFPFASEDTSEALKSSDRVAKHGKNVMKYVDFAVNNLDNLDDVQRRLTSLATRHVDYRAKPQHLDPVSEALLWTIENAIGDSWTPKVQEAWGVVVTFITSTFIAAMK